MGVIYIRSKVSYLLTSYSYCVLSKGEQKNLRRISTHGPCDPGSTTVRVGREAPTHTHPAIPTVSRRPRGTDTRRHTTTRRVPLRQPRPGSKLRGDAIRLYHGAETPSRVRRGRADACVRVAVTRNANGGSHRLVYRNSDELLIPLFRARGYNNRTRRVFITPCSESAGRHAVTRHPSHALFRCSVAAASVASSGRHAPPLRPTTLSPPRPTYCPPRPLPVIKTVIALKNRADGSFWAWLRSGIVLFQVDSCD